MAWLPAGSDASPFEQRVDQRPDAERQPEPTLKPVRSVKLPVFPVPDAIWPSPQGSAATTTNDLSIGFKLKPDGSLQPVIQPASDPAARNKAASASATAAKDQGQALASRLWLVDLGSVQQALNPIDRRILPDQLQALHLQLDASARGLFSVSLAASDDLRSWTMLAPEHAPIRLAQLQHDGAQVQQLSIDAQALMPASGVQPQRVPRYLMLQWLHTSAPPQLIGLTAALTSSTLNAPAGSSIGTSALAPPSRAWTVPIRPVRCERRWCDYALPTHVPIEQLDIQLGLVNSLVPLTVYGLPASQTAAGALSGAPPSTGSPATDEPDSGARSHSHNPLKVLHRKTAEHRHGREPLRTDEGLPMHRLAQHTAYWLQTDGQDLRSNVVSLNTRHYPSVRLQADNAGTDLAALAPTLRLGVTPPGLIWLAQGPAPFALQISPTTGASAAVALETLVPRAPNGERLPLTLGMSEVIAQQDISKGHGSASNTAAAASGRERQTSTPSSSSPATAATPADASPVQTRQLVLWGSLGVALLVLGVMARSVLNGVSGTTQQGLDASGDASPMAGPGTTRSDQPTTASPTPDAAANHAKRNA